MSSAVGYASADGDRADVDPTHSESRRIARWRRVFDLAYRATNDPLCGWESRVDGRPLPAAEMREWLYETALFVLEGRPKRLLEIGCGTGLLARAIAPRLQAYFGLDLSAAAIEGLRRSAWPAATPPRLAVAAAHEVPHDWSGFDTVVLNSVVQYFPSQAYLSDVVRHAVGVARKGGAIVIGDVRHRDLLDLLCTSAAWARLPPATLARTARAQIRAALESEEELLLSPADAWGLAALDARISGVELSPRRARTANELNDFRFDVRIRLDGPPAEPVACARAWRDLADPAEAERWMASAPHAAAAILDVPTGRLSLHHWRRARLAAAHPDQTLAELSAGPPEPDGRLSRLMEGAARQGFQGRLVWFAGQAPELADLLLTRPSRSRAPWSPRPPVDPPTPEAGAVGALEAAIGQLAGPRRGGAPAAGRRG